MTINKHDETYHELLKDVLENGELVTTRAVLPSTGRPVGAYTVFGRQVRYDLRKGFPLLTTKKVPFRLVAAELLWFLSGSSMVQDLHKHGEIRIWDAWAAKEHTSKFGREEGDLGPIYGPSFRRWENSSDSIVLVDKRVKEEDSVFIYQNALIDPKTVEQNSLTGQKFTMTSGEEIIVLDKVSLKGEKNSRYRIQFLSNGFVKTATKPEINMKSIKNDYALNVKNVACVGVPTKNYTRHEYDIWHNMISRCYDPNHPSYALYGGRGVTTSSSWRCFENFLNDLNSIPYYNSWKLNPSDYCLDKDYFGSDQYSKTTTIFLDKEYNKLLAKMPRAFTCDGEVFVSMKECAKKYGLDRRRISEILSNKRIIPNYPKFKWIDPPENKLYRKQRVIDQIARLIEGIKKNPTGRRHIVTGWNPATCDKVSLPPCHTLFQFNVSHGGTRLNCQLYQRSGDLFLGIPFNVASYALLTHMIAQVCGLEVGEFIHSFGDLHIYENHVEQVREQLARESFAAPMLAIDPAIKDIDKFELKHLQIAHYQSHPTIKAEVAV